MKFNITRDQHDRRVLQCELPIAGYFLIRKDGMRPVLSLEEFQHRWFRRFSRSIGAIGTIITFADVVAYGAGFTFGFIGVVMMLISGIGEFVKLLEINEHQVIRMSTERLSINDQEPEVRTNEE